MKNLHGVFLKIFDKGVLLSAAPGYGKSDCALQLLSRGHCLIADDAPCFFQSEKREVIGFCEKAWLGLLEIRALGIVDVRQIYGQTAVCESHTLDLIIHFTDKIIESDLDDRQVEFKLRETQLLNIPIPTLTLVLAFTQNAAILVEAAVRLAFAPKISTIEQFMTSELTPCD